MASRPVLALAPRGRNKLETGVSQQLSDAGISYEYEGGWLRYTVPSREGKYLPDWRCGKIIIEAKGWFGQNGAKERQKYILVRDSHPHLDIRFVFSDARKPIYKGSKTTYAQWAEDHGFKWSTNGTIPNAWLTDLRQEMQDGETQLRKADDLPRRQGKLGARIVNHAAGEDGSGASAAARGHHSTKGRRRVRHLQARRLHLRNPQRGL